MATEDVETIPETVMVSAWLPGGVATRNQLEGIYKSWRVTASRVKEKRDLGFVDSKVPDYDSRPFLYVDTHGGKRHHNHYALANPLNLPYELCGVVGLKFGAPEDEKTIRKSFLGEPQIQFREWATKDMQAPENEGVFDTQDYRLLEATLVRTVIGSKKTVVTGALGRKCHLILRRRKRRPKS